MELSTVWVPQEERGTVSLMLAWLVFVLTYLRIVTNCRLIVIHIHFLKTCCFSCFSGCVWLCVRRCVFCKRVLPTHKKVVKIMRDPDRAFYSTFLAHSENPSEQEGDHSPA